MKIIKITDKMYDREIFYVYELDAKAFYKRFKDLTFNCNITDYCKGMMFDGRDKDNSSVFFVVINRHKTRFEMECTLIHELFHLTLAIGEYNNFEITKASDEPLAYYNEHLYQQFFKAIWKK